MRFGEFDSFADDIWKPPNSNLSYMNNWCRWRHLDFSNGKFVQRNSFMCALHALNVVDNKELKGTGKLSVGCLNCY